MNFGEREGKVKAKHRGQVLEKVYYVVGLIVGGVGREEHRGALGLGSW